MRLRHMCAAAVAICSLAVSPRTASADWLLTPFAGITFGGDTEGRHATFGGSIGYMGNGAVGFEVDFGYAPGFFSPEDNAGAAPSRDFQVLSPRIFDVFLRAAVQVTE